MEGSPHRENIVQIVVTEKWSGLRERGCVRERTRK